MSSLGKLENDLMKVPRLEAGGTNWVVYKDCFLWTVDARGLLEHVDGSKREPVCPVKPRMVPRRDSEGKDTRNFVQDANTEEENRGIKEWKAELKEWKRGEAMVKQQIAATIPDSLFMKIRNKGTALEIWDALRGDFQNKSRMVAVDMRRRLQQERCAEKGDVREHFSKLRLMREDLASIGHPPGEDELYAIILGSLTYSFEPFISALNATSAVLGTILSPNDLMQAFTDEYDRRNLGKVSKKDENVAFSADDGGKGRNFKRGNCYNCDKPGHRKDDCWEEGGGKEGQKPNWLKEKEKWRKEKEDGNGKEKEKEKPKATTAMAEEIVAWMVLCPPDSDSEDDNDIIVSNTVTLEDFLDVEEEPRKEYYSIQDTDPVSAKNKAHKTDGSESDDESQDWWDEPVEGEKDVDERIDTMGNQILQLAKPKPEEVERTDDDLPAIEAKFEPEKLLLAQPEEQGECRGKAASEEDGEGADEANEANRALSPETKDDAKSNPGKGDDTKSNPREEDDAKSNPDIPTHTQSNLDDADLVSTPLDQNETLSKGQHPSSITDFAKMNDVPFREGIGSPTHLQKFREDPLQIPSDKSRGGTSCINARKDEEGVTHLDRAERDLRGLEGRESSDGAVEMKKNYLPVLQDAGGVPQHRMVGYRPMVDGRLVPGTPRKEANAMWTTKAEED